MNTENPVPKDDGEAGCKTERQGEMLFNRLVKRKKHLQKWARRAGTDAFRLYDRDIPEIPLVLDLYRDGVAGALYKRPFEREEEKEEAWLACMTDAVARALDIDRKRIFLKQRRHQRGKDQYARTDTRNIGSEVREGDLRFKVNLSDYLDTGLFLDQRKTRSLVRGEAREKRVLNLFCYTGSFSVYAAAGGALEVDSVDLSNTYLDWARDNFSLNGFRAEKISARDFSGGKRKARLLLIRDDVFSFIEKAAGRFTWDRVILDPPTFSNSKKMSGFLDLRRDYKKLAGDCLALLASGGRLYFSANARRFTLKPEDFPEAAVTDIAGKTVSEDFKKRKGRSCYTLDPIEPRELFRAPRSF